MRVIKAAKRPSPSVLLSQTHTSQCLCSLVLYSQQVHVAQTVFSGAKMETVEPNAMSGSLVLTVGKSSVMMEGVSLTANYVLIQKMDAHGTCLSSVPTKPHVLVMFPCV